MINMQYEVENKGHFKMIHIIGNISLEVSTKVLDDTITEFIENGHHHFVFNLERTTYLDSSGIGIFIHCLCDVQENNGSIYIIAEDNQVKEVLRMVGINRLIKVYDSEEEFISDHKEAAS